MKVVEDYVSPSRVALAMADRYQQTFLDRLSDETNIERDQLTRGVAFNDAFVDTVNQIVRELASTYGTDTVKECSASILTFDETADGEEVVRVLTDSTPLARDILRAQHEAGLVDAGYKDGELVLGWNEPGTGLKVEIRHNDELLVWATIVGQVEPLTAAHLAQFPKPELKKLQVQQPKLAEALGGAVIDREPAEALMKLSLQWLSPKHCGPLLSKLSDQQASVYLEAIGNDLTPEQQRAFATAVLKQRRLPLLDHVGSWCTSSPSVHMTMAHGLGNALAKDDAVAIEAYGKVLAQLTLARSLSPEQLEGLLAAKAHGTPGLYFALQEGQAVAIEAYGKVLAGLTPYLSPEQLEGLLAARIEDGSPGLAAALQQGQAVAIEAYGKVLAGLTPYLSPEQLDGLLAAKRAHGTPGLFLALALQQGQAVAIEAYGKVLAGLTPYLSPEQLDGLLAAKRAHGTPGLFLALALQQGQAVAIEAYGKVLAGLTPYLSPEQLDGLLAAKRADGTPGLAVALQQGHANRIEAYGKVLAGLTPYLSPEQLDGLLAAKRADGTPGLSMALQQGQAVAIEAYGKVLARCGRDS
ncbi:hypothetical protein WI88_24740 [Burkholderia ubonensis]|nr:hypothetical protein WI88_24740 [Burkholderia ubonensis]